MTLHRQIVMIGPAPSGRGGMASVIDVYRTQGLFDKWPVSFLATHVEGAKLEKIRAGLVALAAVVWGLATRRIAVLHIHVAQRTSFYRKAVFATLAVAFRTPYLFHMHGSEFREFYSGSSAVARIFIRWILRNAWAVISLSASWRDWVLSVEPLANVVVVYNPIAVNVQTGRQAHRPHNRNILFLGRLGQRKGIYDLLQVIARLRDKFPDIRLICGGDGELDEVRARADELGIAEHVSVVGWVNGDAKLQLQSQALIYVLPSYNEGLPMAILEAMAAGIPVVASNVGGIPDAIDDGVDGFLVEPGDISALSDRLTTLLLDPSVASDIGRKGQEKANKKFAATVIFESLGDIYRAAGCVPNMCKEDRTRVN